MRLAVLLSLPLSGCVLFSNKQPEDPQAYPPESAEVHPSKSAPGFWYSHRYELAGAIIVGILGAVGVGVKNRDT